MTQSNALAVREQNNQISTTRAQDIDIFRLGQAFARSGYFQDAKDEAQAVVKIIYGQELGISPAASMSGIHIISGKPVLSATALAGLIKSRKPVYDYKVLKHDGEICELEFFENGKSVGKSMFSMEKAKQAELLGGKNINWKKYPENMLFARAISNGARLYCPDIFTGSPVYTPDELGGVVDSDGEMIVDATENHSPNKVINVTNESKAVAPNSSSAVAANSVCPEMRNEVEAILKRLNIDPAKSLKKFDTFTKSEECENALTLVLRQAVKTGIAGQVNAENGWSEEDITGYLSEWSVEGVDSASLDQLRAIYADQIKTKML